MEFKFKYTDKIVGIFVLLSIFLLLFVFILIIFNQKFFTKKFYFSSAFNDANGLKLNQDIIFKGFKIGKINKITLNASNQIDVDFFIYEKYINRITENSILNKASNPISGSSIIFTQNEFNNRIADEYSFIPSLDTKAGQFLLEIGEVEKKADDISNIISNIDKFMASLNKDRNADDNSIARILVNTADIVESVKGELDSIDTILTNVKLLSNKMKTPDGLVQRLIDPEGDIMFKSIKSSLDNLALIMSDLAVVSKILNSKSKDIENIITDSKMTMKDAQDIIEGLKTNTVLKNIINEDEEQDVVKDSIRDRDF